MRQERQRVQERERGGCGSGSRRGSDRRRGRPVATVVGVDVVARRTVRFGDRLHRW